MSAFAPIMKAIVAEKDGHKHFVVLNDQERATLTTNSQAYVVPFVRSLGCGIVYGVATAAAESLIVAFDLALCHCKPSDVGSLLFMGIMGASSITAAVATTLYKTKACAEERMAAAFLLEKGVRPLEACAGLKALSAEEVQGRELTFFPGAPTAILGKSAGSPSPVLGGGV